MDWKRDLSTCLGFAAIAFTTTSSTSITTILTIDISNAVTITLFLVVPFAGSSTGTCAGTFSQLGQRNE